MEEVLLMMPAVTSCAERWARILFVISSWFWAREINPILVKRRIEWTERTAMPRVIAILWDGDDIDDDSIRQGYEGAWE
jgi:hypothetical protein